MVGVVVVIVVEYCLYTPPKQGCECARSGKSVFLRGFFLKRRLVVLVAALHEIFISYKKIF